MKMKAESERHQKGTFPGLVSGTYLHVEVTPSWEPDQFDFPPDLRYSVVYLLPSGHFAWLNYWSGFHYGRCAGRFTRSGARLELEGRESLLCDTPDQNYSHKSFHRQLTLRQSNGKRVLLGLSQKEHQFIGWGIYIPFNGLGGHLFPQSWGELHGWIEGFLEMGPPSGYPGYSWNVAPMPVKRAQLKYKAKNVQIRLPLESVPCQKRSRSHSTR